MEMVWANADFPLMIEAERPQAWPQRATTRDGAGYRVRPIRPDDRARDRAFLVGLSPQSRYRRMMGPVREPSPTLLDSLVCVDYHHAMALVAVVGEGDAESIIGVARYAGNPDCCEFAIAVADEWQGRGVGTHLSEMLFAYAKANGVRRMYATMLADNYHMLQLATDLRMSVGRSPEDDAVIDAWRTL